MFTDCTFKPGLWTSWHLKITTTWQQKHRRGLYHKARLKYPVNSWLTFNQVQSPWQQMSAAQILRPDHREPNVHNRQINNKETFHGLFGFKCEFMTNWGELIIKYLQDDKLFNRLVTAPILLHSDKDFYKISVNILIYNKINTLFSISCNQTAPLTSQFLLMWNEYLTSNGCPGTKGKFCSSLSSLPHFCPMQLFLTITLFPPSLKRGLKWKARSFAVFRSSVILKNNKDHHTVLKPLDSKTVQTLFCFYGHQAKTNGSYRHHQ